MKIWLFELAGLTLGEGVMIMFVWGLGSGLGGEIG